MSRWRVESSNPQSGIMICNWGDVRGEEGFRCEV